MKVFVTLLDFSAQPAVILPRSDSVPGELCPLAPPRYALVPTIPIGKLTHSIFVFKFESHVGL